MEISYDAEKRQRTLCERGLDFDDAVHVFAGPEFSVEDDRRDYGEMWFQTFGPLHGRLVTLVWTARSEARHVISMRKCNEREQERYEKQLRRSR
jgi:hypothetical protein